MLNKDSKKTTSSLTPSTPENPSDFMTCWMKIDTPLEEPEKHVSMIHREEKLAVNPSEIGSTTLW